MTVDKGELEQLARGYKAALGMVARLNTRIAGWSTWARCQATIIETGKTPAGC